MEKTAKPLPQQQIKEAFLQLASADSTQMRDSLFSQLAAENPQLADEVRSLLKASEAGNVIEQICGLAGDPLLAQTNISNPDAVTPALERSRRGIGEGPGTVLGPYKLLEQIGQGGMGTVFHAQQSKPIRRKVALKIIKPGMDTGQVVARFEAERQALALMDHPNIAKVLDAGATDLGRPYFVMELVKGVPITDYCDREKLDTDQRLKLFIDVCHGVQHAHQKGIIHRDLKPGNILVTLHDGKPVVKIIDFGIAKAIDQELTERTLFTQMSEMIGTPLYMSPEQAEVNGLDIDTRSDVYSLGVLLYELLTGTTPFDRETMKKAGLAEVRRMIRETEPPKPSQRFSTLKANVDSTSNKLQSHALKRSQLELQGELDWIVMKSLEKEHNRRYESASAFAADVIRYLNDEPVLACPPTLAYRLRKYTTRYRGLLTTAAMLLTMLCVATGVSVSYAIQAKQASKEALDARDDANIQKDSAVAAQALSDQRLKQSRVDFDRALQSLDTIVTEVSSAEFAQMPGADRVRDEILGKALAFYREIIDEHDNDPFAREKQALAHRKIANIHAGKGDNEANLRELNESIRLLEELIQEHPDELHFQKSLTLPLFARMHASNSKNNQRLADSERCLDIVTRCDAAGIENNPTETALLYLKVAEMLPTDSVRARQMIDASIQTTQSHGLPPVPGTEVWLSFRASEKGDAETALKHIQRSIELFDAIGADVTRRDRYIERWLSATQMERMGLEYENLKQPDKAEDAYLRSVRSTGQLYREYHENQLIRNAFRDRVAFFVRFLNGQHRELDALKILDELTKEFPEFVALYVAKVRLHFRLGQPDEAHAACQKAVEQGVHDATSLIELAEILARQPGDDQQALILLERVLDAAPANGDAFRLRSQIHLQRGDLKMAIADADNAVFLAASSASFFDRARVHIAMKRLDLALLDVDRALELQLNNNGALLKARGAIHFDLGNYQEALADFTRVIDLYQWDVFVISEVSAEVINACPSTEFRDGMIKLADHCVEHNKESTASLQARAQLLAGLGVHEKARQDLQKILSQDSDRYYQQYQAALLSIKLEDLDDYRSGCQNILETTTETAEALGKHFAGWTCALAPNAIADYTIAVTFARAAVEAEPQNPLFLNGLGAILMRAGQYAEAKIALEKALAADEAESTSKTYVRYFLATTEHHLGNADAASLQLKTANELAEAELSGSIPWNRRLTIELLRKEAQELIGDVDK